MILLKISGDGEKPRVFAPWHVRTLFLDLPAAKWHEERA
jgi:hypothetical protein